MTNKSSDGVAPSKGAMRAAQATLDVIDERITFFAYEKEKPKNLEMVAEIIDRETKSPQMAELLRELVTLIQIWRTEGKPDFYAILSSQERAESLLTELEGKL